MIVLTKSVLSSKVQSSRTTFLALLSFAFLAGVVSSFQAFGATDTEFVLQQKGQPERLQEMMNPKEGSSGLTWLGADAATSIRVNPDRYVWLFGDTIIGKSEEGIRDYSVFIHNTIGVYERVEKGNFTRIRKCYREEGEKIKPIFESDESETFYWPLVGAKLDSSLLIAGSKVTTKNSESFKVLGTTFFNVENPEDPPESWRYESQFVPKDGDITWGNALVRRDEWVYVFGQKGTGLSSRTVLSKLTVSDAEEGSWSQRLNYVDGKWKSDTAPEPIEGLPGTSETTVQYNPFFGWYSLQIPPLSFDVHLYTADKLKGPWHDQGTVYTVPSPWSKEKTEDGKHVFSAYAVKSHPELSKANNEIVLTYNVNLNPFVSDLKNELGDYIQKKKYSELYIPQFVSLEFEKNGTG